MLKQVIPKIRSVVLPTDQLELRQEYGKRLMVALNTHADLGRRLLKSRELKKQGMSDEKILEFLKSWETENIF